MNEVKGVFLSKAYMNIENRIKIKILKVSHFTSPPPTKPKLRYKGNKKVNDWFVIAICSPHTQFMSPLISSPAHGKQEGYRKSNENQKTQESQSVKN